MHQIDYTLCFESSWSRGCGVFKNYRKLHSIGSDTLKTLVRLMFVSCVLGGGKKKKKSLPSVHISAPLSIIPLLHVPSWSVENNEMKLRVLTFILQKLASIFSCSTSFLAWPTLMVLFTGVSPFILSTTATCHRSYHPLPFMQHSQSQSACCNRGGRIGLRLQN